MLSDENRVIVERLLSKAKAGKVAWDTPGAAGLSGLAALIAGAPTVSVTLPGARISIAKSVGDNFRFSVSNAAGIEISASDVLESDSGYKTVRELFSIGWRQARKYDETMKAVEEFLASEEVPHKK